MSPFESVRQAMASCEGYTVHALTLSLVDGSDMLEVGLRWGPHKPDAVLSFQRIYQFSVGRSPDDAVPFLDKIETVELPPASGPWPAGLDMNLTRTPDLPPLLWTRTEGPVRLSVVAAIVQLYEEVR